MYYVDSIQRTLILQSLEQRFCMASVMQNAALPLDVNQSGLVSPVDALQVINWINRHADFELPKVRQESDPLVDTNGDGFATAIDALLVLNGLSRYARDLSLIGNWDRASDPNGNGVVLQDQVSFVGQTLPGARVALLSPAGNVVDQVDRVGDDGRFQLSASIDVGTHDFDLVASDPLGRQSEITRRVQRGDVILDWNATALNVVREWTTTSDDPYTGRIVTSEPPRVARNLAMIHTAMFDAANAIDLGFESYLPNIVSASQADAGAAAASAAYAVATSLYPDADSMAYWNATRDESLQSIPDGPAKTAGIALGQTVGLQMLAARDGDGSESSIDYTHGDQPGDWQRTFPGYLPPLLPHWVSVSPFAVDDVADFRPAAPPALDSASYAAAVDEVMQLGGLSSESRTEDQTEIAIFWADGGGTFTPPGHWNQIAADVVIARDQSLVDNARTFALLNLALADAGIAAWDAKYHFDLWRPIDAIQQADTDGNPNTVQDTSWRPLLVSPPFPTYTSGHSSFSGAADAVLTALLGQDVAFTSQTDAQSALGQRPLNPDLIVTRSFTSFQQAAEEAGLSRIYGGIHFGFDNTAGLQAGRAIGVTVVDNLLRSVVS